MLTKERILKDFNNIFKRYPFKITIFVVKQTNNNYGNFFNIDTANSIEKYEFEAIIIAPQPGAVRNQEYRTSDVEYSLFVKPRTDVTISFDDEIEWNGEKYAITYIGGATDENNNWLWYEIRMKKK